MAYYYEDTSHYCYTVPAYYDNTSAHYDSPSDPIYYNDNPQTADLSYDDYVPSEPYIPSESYDDYTLPVKFCDEDTAASNDNYLQPDPADYDDTPSYDEIHPAYHDHPMDNNYQDSINTYPSHITVNAPPHDRINLTINHNDIDNYLSDDELTKRVEWLEETLKEMIDWDAEDMENRVMGRSVPGVNPPDEPYQESDEFKGLVRDLELVVAVQRRRIEGNIEDRGDEVLENPIAPPAPPQLIPPPPHTPVFRLAVIKRREPRYHLGPHVRRRHFPKIRTTAPPYIRLPRPHPLSPNIHTRSHRHSCPYRTPPDIRTPQPLPLVPNISSYQQPRHPPHICPQRKHPPVSPSPRQNVDRRHNAICRISKRCSRMNIT
jgi:hypothetical protein